MWQIRAEWLELPQLDNLVRKDFDKLNSEPRWLRQRGSRGNFSCILVFKKLDTLKFTCTP